MSGIGYKHNEVTKSTFRRKALSTARAAGDPSGLFGRRAFGGGAKSLTQEAQHDNEDAEGAW
jgi:hypothetical protein